MDTEDARSARLQVRRRLETQARVLDELVRIPGTPIKVGLDAVIGLVPVAGDLAGLALGLWMIWQARSAKAPRELVWKMLRNLGIETVIGAVPIAGDIFDVAWRANSRNRDLLVDWMDAVDAPPEPPRRSAWSWWWLAGLAVLAAVLIWTQTG